MVAGIRAMNDALKPDPDCACDGCGQFDAFRFEAEALCAECIAGRGSCCSAEFNGSAPDCAPELPAHKVERMAD